MLSEGAIWNLPFWLLGGMTVLLMWLWPLGSDKEFGSGERPHAEGEGRKRPHGRSVNPIRSHPFPVKQGGRSRVK